MPQTSYPDPPAHDVNQVHQVHIVGPRYLTGDKTKYYFLICNDAFDQAVYAEFHAGCSMDQVWLFLIHAWQQLGLPQDVQFDNGKSLYGWGRWARSLNRVMRLALRLGVHPVFIPAARPQRNGSVENFNGWFQPALLSQPFPNALAVRRAVRQLLMTANEPHGHQHLGYKTAAQFRHGKRLRKLPANCALNLAQIPVAIGQITFIRWLSLHRRVDILGESVSGGRCPRYQYVKLVLDTRRQHRKVYHTGRLIKQTSFQLRIS